MNGHCVIAPITVTPTLYRSSLFSDDEAASGLFNKGRLTLACCWR